MLFITRIFSELIYILYAANKQLYLTGTTLLIPACNVHTPCTHVKGKQTVAYLPVSMKINWIWPLLYIIVSTVCSDVCSMRHGYGSTGFVHILYK